MSASRFSLTVATLLMPLAAVSAETSSPQKLEEILVTGDPMSRSSLDTVSSISIIPEEQLQALNIRDLYDLLLRSPNLNAAREDKFSVRGISNEGIGPGGAGRPTVSIFIDGARQPGRGVANSWDVQQMEFYRGPQSTAFGPGSLAGAVVVQTRDPSTEEYSGEVKLGAANYNGREAGIAIGGPLVGGFAFRYAAETNQTDGEVTNTTRDDDEWQARKRYMQRLKLSWDGGGWYSAILTLQDSKLREGNEYLPPETAEDGESTDDVDGFYDDNSQLWVLSQHADLSDAVRLSFIASHAENYNQRKGDYDISDENNGYFINTVDTENDSLELRLHYQSNFIKAVAGLYHSNDELIGSSSSIDLPYSISGMQLRADADLEADRDATTNAIYSEADINLSERWTLTLGARYEENEADNRSAFIVTGAELIDPITGTTIPGDVSPLLKPILDSDTTAASGDDVFLPKIAISFQINDELSAFLTRSQGYRAGSVDFVSDGESPSYGPEYTNNYDLGMKFQRGSWFVQGSIFRIDYEDMQIGVRVDASNFRTDNAGEAKSEGAELEFRGDIGYGFSVFGGVGYVDTAFVEYEDDGVDYAGNHFPNAPRNTANFGLRYANDSGFYSDISWSRTDGSYIDRENTPTLLADARDLFGARIGFQGEHFGGELYGQNLTDKFYITDRFNSPSLGIDAVYVGDPREVGARVTYKF
ncbi:Pesticin receptor [Zhongshania aliphaticivorans]|uniref:Pesticin receptor n=1 Tax=Zhongshania aliphaticivorans TaxID=1470434 RepID=A0A5S9N747_9GAMM|nr:TonB-dependent receptor [Zhongshania aliphaticivorans]CAA0080569.1 Pesticin receptor [Zhongshania aliphaticivorans]CAA0085664.1 Pesticin receptor [Zhongshania aliphaticivorans]